MAATIIDGTATAAEVKERVAAALKAAGSPTVTLATVLVGDDPPSQRYIRGKAKASEAVGITSRHTDLPATSSQAEVEDVVAALAADPTVHGILVQLPLPDGLDSRPVINLIPPVKDVDGLTDASLGRLVQGVPGHVGATPRGVMQLLARYDVPIAGRRAVVIGRSLLVGLPGVAAARPQGRRRDRDHGALPHARPRRGVRAVRHRRGRGGIGAHDHEGAREARAQP